jgi:hypothetical protein
MSKVKTEVEIRFEGRILDALEEALPTALEVIGMESVRLIKGKTRQGFDMSRGNDVSQPRLKQSTIKQRERISKHTETHDVFDAETSNLTFSGQMLDALEHSVRGDLVFVEVADSNRRPYSYVPTRGKNKGQQVNVKNTPSNKEVAKFLAEKGRTFLGLDEQSKQIIANKIKRLLRGTLKRR